MPEFMKQPDGSVIFGQEISFTGDFEWRPSISQVRDAILTYRVTGMNSAGLPLLPESREFASTQKEVERFSILCRQAVLAGRVIDFGHLPNLVIMECAKRGGKLWNLGALGFPFRDPWICYHTWDHQIKWQGEGPAPPPLQSTRAVAAYLVNLSDETTFEVCELQPMRFTESAMLVIGDRGLFMVPEEKDGGHVSCIAPSMLRFMADNNLRALQNNGQTPQQAASCNIGDPVMCCLLILATRGVDRETIVASDKLQRARAKNRKPPIPNYDKVHTEPYVTAILARTHREKTAGLGGSHARPIFHIRMGHPRNYATGRSIWISDTLVNATDEQRHSFKSQRSHYQVRP